MRKSLGVNENAPFTLITSMGNRTLILWGTVMVREKKERAKSKRGRRGRRNDDNIDDNCRDWTRCCFCGRLFRQRAAVSSLCTHNLQGTLFLTHSLSCSLPPSWSLTTLTCSLLQFQDRHLIASSVKISHVIKVLSRCYPWIDKLKFTKLKGSTLIAEIKILFCFFLMLY